MHLQLNFSVRSDDNQVLFWRIVNRLYDVPVPIPIHRRQPEKTEHQRLYRGRFAIADRLETATPQSVQRQQCDSRIRRCAAETALRRDSFVSVICATLRRLKLLPQAVAALTIRLVSSVGMAGSSQ
jgi:hypothetical protein